MSTASSRHWAEGEAATLHRHQPPCSGASRASLRVQLLRQAASSFSLYTTPPPPVIAVHQARPVAAATVQPRPRQQRRPALPCPAALRDGGVVGGGAGGLVGGAQLRAVRGLGDQQLGGRCGDHQHDGRQDPPHGYCDGHPHYANILQSELCRFLTLRRAEIKIHFTFVDKIVVN